MSAANGLNRLLGGNYAICFAINEATWKAKKVSKPIINGFCMGPFMLSFNGCKNNFGLMAQLTKRASRPMLCSEVLAAVLCDSK